MVAKYPAQAMQMESLPIDTMPVSVVKDMRR
jgi:hypothetical protein